ncbi:hypothetical protein [uncultured Pseudodesulfovibrio sp.]|uniref:hypothetical protein n=1 Tax=uncultured Pseudodesulfovibrio sp. TaxID=2035858 RepID=UPI0029C728DE|nr:hypothetical protein [uncultured Pseudodesulfovibrio sp.]
MPLRPLYYDKNDYKLLEILNDLSQREVDHAQFKTILAPYLRPHGIKELAAEPGIRIAYAIMHLLSSLESDQASDRIKALTALRDETHAAARGSMRKNRARVLIQIGKELIRAKGNTQRQLGLAHDFRTAALGKTSFLRKQLKKYHLLEMPEAWNQVTFDDRVHDANSKGRKSATHLIMDAWVKGIRHLTVVYYDFMEPDVAKELFASARILGISVRIGIEYKARFGDRFVKIVWDPKDLQEESDICGFFGQERVRELMTLGREVQAYRTRYVQAVTQAFNDTHRSSIAKEFGICLPEIHYDDVARTIGTGQPSIFHLGRHIHEIALPIFADRVATLKKEYANADYDSQAAILLQLESLNSLDADTIIARYLVPEENRDIPNPDAPSSDADEPTLLTLSPEKLTAQLRRACRSSHLTLILFDLELKDAIELLYDCKGRITHFELFNIKNISDYQIVQRKPFCLLQKAINEQNAVTLKRIIFNCVAQLKESESPDTEEQSGKLKTILADFSTLLDYYKRVTIRTKIGSGSTGGSTRTHGMGFAVRDTLPLKTRMEIRRRESHGCVPVYCETTESIEFTPPSRKKGIVSKITQAACRIPGIRSLTCPRKQRWHIDGYTVEDESCGNVMTLGGQSDNDNGLSLDPAKKKKEERPSLDRLNSTLKNLSKVIIGFIPAFLTFSLTKDWWLLAYFGGVIWFTITALRNVIQSVLGGGGFRRSPYLGWNDYIDWERISDSLLYTGFSVPLLDWLCKSMLLDKGFGITTATNPVLLYSIMALTNGIYISSHNLIRGLPHQAALGNFFRSILSIPVAMLFNFGVGVALHAAGAPDVAGVLQLWAAVISKFASDCVAGIIEGLADRSHNIAMRQWDYSEKLKQIFALFSRLEIEFPTKDMLKTMNEPAEFLAMSNEATANHAPEVIANALDMLYIRAYKPRAGDALRQAMEDMTDDEMEVFLASQQILTREKDISHLFVNGLVGRNFAKALAFYLLRYKEYLKEIQKVAAQAKARDLN